MSEIWAKGDLILQPSEMGANRWYYERLKLGLFPSVALLGANGQVTAAEGVLETQYSNSYGVRVVLEEFPDALPRVFPKGWAVHPNVTHKFNDGSICIMKSIQWRRNFTVALVVAKAAIWLGKYEMWKRNGHTWPGLEQRH